MAKIIGITGSQGIIGKILYKKLNDLNCKIDCFDGDLRSQKDIESWMRGKKFNNIFHLAAIVPIQKVNKNSFEAYNVNVGGTINLLSCIRQLNIRPWIFYSSTSHVYKSKNGKIKENDTISPLNKYGETKYIAEKICQGFENSYNYKICIGRIFSFFHDTQKIPFLYPTIRKRIRLEDLSKPFLLSGADNIRDFMDAENIVDIMIKLMHLKYEGIVNIGSGIGKSISTFVQEQTKFNLDIVKINDSKPSSLVADIRKLNKLLDNYGKK